MPWGGQLIDGVQQDDHAVAVCHAIQFEPVFLGYAGDALHYETRLKRHPAPAPQADCKCGLYAWYRPDSTSIYPGPVFGAVTYAAWQHRVPVFDSAEALVAEFPPQDVTEIGVTVDETPAVLPISFQLPSGARIGVDADGDENPAVIVIDPPAGPVTT